MSPLIGPDSTIAFPSERKVVRMDAQPGTDYLLMLYSEEPLDINLLREAMDQNEGTLSEKIAQSLGRRIVPDAFIERSADGIGFRVTQKTVGSIVPLMVELAHN